MTHPPSSQCGYRIDAPLDATVPNDLLIDPVVRVALADGRRLSVSLPEVLSLLTADAIDDFPGLRAHQRHPWHAFLVQVAALAMHRAYAPSPFENAATWAESLRALAPGQPSAWWLVAPQDVPAFLQAPDPRAKLAEWRTALSPDAIDILVTSRNHDVKQRRIVDASSDDWLFALLSLQTQEGFLGSGNYGISRMNGGFASRPGVGIVPSGGPGRRWIRDVRAVLDARDRTIRDLGLSETGVALVWLKPWSGEGSIAFESLDPFYIEICRRVRLVRVPQGWRAFYTGSASARVESKARSGVTGDPWTPVRRAEAKALTVSAQGFDYRLMSELLFGSPGGEQPFEPAIAQRWRLDDDTEGVSVLARVVVRGQGKTEGYHERAVPVSRTIRRMLLAHRTDEVATSASLRVEAISNVTARVLKPSLFRLLQAGPARINFDARSTAAQVQAILRRFEAAEDARFFTDLGEEFDSDDPVAVRFAWKRTLIDRARAALLEAFHSGPQVGERRYRARADALKGFEAGVRTVFPDVYAVISLRSSEGDSIDVDV
jgi:CRISPR system Cascade subunit CasA